MYKLLVVALVVVGCSSPDDGKNGKNGVSCSVEQAVNGAVISCTDGTSTAITNGQDGSDGIDAVAELIDPCGDNPGHFDEVVLRLGTGELLVYFESGSNRFLSLIGNGSYSTTDSQHCHFSVTNGVVSW